MDKFIQLESIDDLLYLLYDSKSNNLDTKEHLMTSPETSHRQTGKEVSVVFIIIGKIREYKADLEITSTTKTISANSIKELEIIYDRNSRLLPTRRRARGERYPWALVQKVTIHFDFPYGNEGGVIRPQSCARSRSTRKIWASLA